MKKIATIGGGTGSFAVLRALKQIGDIAISAIVPVTDSGGSTGKLREQFKIAAVGDARQALSALSRDPKMAKKMNKRDANGHAFGNLVLADLEKIESSPTSAFAAAAETFAVNDTDQVVPVSDARNAELVAETETGEMLKGEHEIDANKGQIKKLKYAQEIKIGEVAKNIIEQADYVIICPGSWYTSLLPNFLVQGFPAASKNSKAKIIFIENIGENNYDPEIIQTYFGRPADFVIESAGLESEEKISKLPNDPLPRSTRRHDITKLSLKLKNIINK